ncbi:MAG: aspartate aminotransferase family protein [Anaerolineaceae bacterium]|nr:aspartate aminotransferase family protein [Anaerolineaceae bacterium]
MTQINRDRLHAALKAEDEHFIENHPQSRILFEQAQNNLLSGVPMNWMIRWASPFPVFVDAAQGAHFTDMDGQRYLDFCLGDTGAMAGHVPRATVNAISAQLQRGLTFMLPTKDALWVGKELERRFGLPFWQFTLTATDANRFALRLARHITGRSKVLVFNWCYHGTVNESFITLTDGKSHVRRGNIGPAVDPNITSYVVEFNDIPALEAVLANEDVACVLTEPVMTNIGIVHPQAGFHEALREITRRTGTLLIIDETHTICAGIGGYTREHQLEPDLVTIGKPIAGGIPAAVYGISKQVAERIKLKTNKVTSDTSGIGGTLAGNALSLAAIRATLEHVLTEEAYAHTIPLANRFCEGVQSVIDEFALSWHVTRLGCRAEYWFREQPPRNGGEAAAAIDTELDRYMHLASLNRGILMTPFHNMALIAPDTTRADIDFHTQVFREIVQNIF